MTRRTAFLMPVYNPAPEKLALTLNSLMAQSEPADLVIVDENGSVLSNSYEGTRYIGPMKALQYLDKLLKGS